MKRANQIIAELKRLCSVPGPQRDFNRIVELRLELRVVLQDVTPEQRRAGFKVINGAA